MSEYTESRPTSSAPPSAAAASSTPGLAVIDHDEKRLHELGYAQELHRGMGWFSNFAVSFTIISILTGGITTYYLGMIAGGPRVIIWGWLFVGHHGDARRRRHGRGVLELPDRGRALLLGGEARAAGQGAGLELVHRLVQPARSGRGHGVDRLRHGDVHSDSSST